jgi:hypothetical protein
MLSWSLASAAEGYYGKLLAPISADSKHINTQHHVDEKEGNHREDDISDPLT